MAKLLLSSRALVDLKQDGKVKPVSAGAFEPGEAFGQNLNWPTSKPDPVNSASADKGSRNTVCNVLRGVDTKSGAGTLSTWVGTGFPRPSPTVRAAPTSALDPVSSSGSSREPAPTPARCSWSPTPVCAMPCSPTATAFRMIRGLVSPAPRRRGAAARGPTGAEPARIRGRRPGAHPGRLVLVPADGTAPVDRLRPPATGFVRSATT
ncbi:hypothetical protein NKH18_37290 [Streptomyces sp. M10(2022)]